MLGTTKKAIGPLWKEVFDFLLVAVSAINKLSLPEFDVDHHFVPLLGGSSQSVSCLQLPLISHLGIWKGSHNPILKGLKLTMVIKHWTKSWDDSPGILIALPNSWGLPQRMPVTIGWDSLLKMEESWWSLASWWGVATQQIPILAFPYAGKADVELVSGRIPEPSRELFTHSEIRV